MSPLFRVFFRSRFNFAAPSCFRQGWLGCSSPYAIPIDDSSALFGRRPFNGFDLDPLIAQEFFGLERPADLRRVPGGKALCHQIPQHILHGDSELPLSIAKCWPYIFLCCNGSYLIARSMLHTNSPFCSREKGNLSETRHIYQQIVRLSRLTILSSTSIARPEAVCARPLSEAPAVYSHP